MTRDELLRALLLERFSNPVLEHNAAPKSESESLQAQRCSELVAELEQDSRGG